MLNKTILMGRLTRDPELRRTQTGTPVASFTLAVDRGYKNDETDFINIVAWRGTAEFVSKWFKRGQLMAVSGRLQIRTYTDNNGNNRTVTEVVADEAFFADSKNSGTQIGAPNVVCDEPEFEELLMDGDVLPF